MQRRLLAAKTLHRIASQRQKQYADTRRTEEHFHKDDWVLLKSKNLHSKKGTPKLLPRYVDLSRFTRKLARMLMS